MSLKIHVWLFLVAGIVSAVELTVTTPWGSKSLTYIPCRKQLVPGQTWHTQLRNKFDHINGIYFSHTCSLQITGRRHQILLRLLNILQTRQKLILGWIFTPQGGVFAPHRQSICVHMAPCLWEGLIYHTRDLWLHHSLLESALQVD